VGIENGVMLQTCSGVPASRNREGKGAGYTPIADRLQTLRGCKTKLPAKGRTTPSHWRGCISRTEFAMCLFLGY